LKKSTDFSGFLGIDFGHSFLSLLLPPRMLASLAVPLAAAKTAFVSFYDMMWISPYTTTFESPLFNMTCGIFGLPVF
jgi:hypothetical protein